MQKYERREGKVWKWVKAKGYESGTSEGGLLNNATVLEGCITDMRSTEGKGRQKES